MKKLLLDSTMSAVMARDEQHATETVDGYTWTYRINGDTAEICGTCDYDGYDDYDGHPYYTPAISPFPIGDVTIPSTLGGKPVMSIGRSAFYYCSELTGVTIPDSVTSIGREAFCGCSGLTSVTIPDSVTSIGEGAFYNCRGLTSIVFDGNAPSVDNLAFSLPASECAAYVRFDRLGCEDSWYRAWHQGRIHRK